MRQATAASFIMLLLSIMAPNPAGVALFLPLTAVLGIILLWRESRGLE